MSNDISDNLVSVDQLLNELSAACISAASFVDSVTSAKANAGMASVRYVVPSMKVSVRLSLTNSGQKVKGILFSKTTEGFSAETLSQIEMNIVAVPAGGGT